MKNLIISKKLFKLLLLIVAVGTLITVTLLFLLPHNFKPIESNEIIKTEMISRIEEVAEFQDSLTFISFTPFIWDEGYYIDDTVDEAEFMNMLNNRAEYDELTDDEQRLIFFYKRQLIVDLHVMKDEINFDINTDKIDDEWLYIQSSSNAAVRLYK